jgi:hypothetical protein
MYEVCLLCDKPVCKSCIYSCIVPAVLHLRGTTKKFPEFFDIDGLAHLEFVPPGQSVTGHFYMQVLQGLRDAVLRKRRYE